jgi:phage virion morphogenesis protein
MAGVQVGITIEDEDVKRAIQRLVAKSMDLKPALTEIGASLLTSTQRRFEDKKSPDGDPWQNVSPAYALTKKKAGKDPSAILRFQNLLYSSLTYLANRFELAVGSNKTYAAIHQLGGTSDMPPGPAAIVARPYLGVSRNDEGEIGKILLEHLGGALA